MALEPIILIPARIGSTRLPQKALAEIAGKPMIVHVAEQAKKPHSGVLSLQQIITISPKSLPLMDMNVS